MTSRGRAWAVGSIPASLARFNRCRIISLMTALVFLFPGGLAVAQTAAPITLQETQATYQSANQWDNIAAADASGGQAKSFDKNQSEIATWAPNFPMEGDYTVEVWYPTVSGASTSVTYTIIHKTGTTSVAKNQTVGTGGWVSLGKFSFLEGISGSVRVNHTANNSKIKTIVDAVRFTLDLASTTTSTTSTTTTSTSTTTGVVIATTAVAATTTTPVVTTTTVPAGPCASLSISDTPLDSKVVSTSGNIMFIIDDNATMDQEVMTSSDFTKFNVSGTYVSYLFDTSDHANSRTDTNGKRLGDHQQAPEDKGRWKSQWYLHNYVYYNPSSNYEPWPSTTAKVFNNVSPDAPVCDPLAATPSSCTLNLDATYQTVGAVTINNAHYYMINDANGNGARDAGEALYLVLLKQPTAGNYAVEYYLVNDANNNDRVDAGELTLTAAGSVPGAVLVGRSAAAERQNFANWYSYFRRRSKAVINAVARVVATMHSVNAGIFSVNGKVNRPVLPIRTQGVDQSETLLNVLYSYRVDTQHTSNPTPRALHSVGYYFSKDEVAPSNLTAVGSGGREAPSPIADNGGSCQHNFAVVLSDNDYQGQTATVGNVDGAYPDPYYDGDQNTLADVAMLWYVKDLAVNISDNVPTSDLDTAKHQHMVTYGIGFGADGYLPSSWDPYDKNRNPAAWTQVRTNDPRTTMDNLWHATVNGRGEYLKANTPEALAAALNRTVLAIMDRGGTGAGVSVNGDELYESLGSEVRMFQTFYKTKDWTGDLRSFKILENGEVNTSAPLWAASTWLSDTATTDTRYIGTYDGTNGVAFRYASLSAAQKAQLSANAVTAERMVNYLRGDKTYEVKNGGSFRNRAMGLGDIVHSRAVYKNGYLYVGANDGMLHVFDALNDGIERFAYVPNLVFPSLRELTSPAYTHLFYVDNTPYVATMGTKTYLICGLRKGGKGYFCLDITSPNLVNSDAAVASIAKWEYPRTGITDNDLGYSYSKAYIARTNDTTRINGGNTDFEGYVVIFGNGYNSASGKAVLYIMNPVDGTVIQKIDTGVGCANGLSSPALVDVNGDRKVDYVYAGDLKGNMWKFDLTSSNKAQWDVAYRSGGTPKPLFQTRTTGGKPQPITSEPDVMYQCNNKNGYLVLFGTGKYLGDADIADTSVQTIYGIWDYGDDADDSEYLGTFDPAVVPNLSNQAVGVTLLRQSAIYQGWFDTNNDGKIDEATDAWLRIISNNQPNWATQNDTDANQSPNPTVHAGWYFDLPISMERVVTDMMIRDRKAIVISFVPEATPCSAGGYSIVHELDACSGGRLPDAVFDINWDAAINQYDLVVITIPDPDDPSKTITLTVPPSGKKFEGKLYEPAILRDEPREIKYFSSSTGDIEIMTEEAEQRGMYYWKEITQ